MTDRELRARAKIRTAGLRRLKRTTRIAAMTTAALAALFSAVAARSTLGHKRVHTAPSMVRSTATASRIPPPPALPSESGSSPLAPLASSSAPSPSPTQQQPVAVTGGS